MRVLGYVLGFLVFCLVAPTLFRWVESFFRRGWTVAAEELGLEERGGRRSRSLRGTVGAAAVEVVWSRRLDATGTVVAAGDSVSTTTAASGTVFTARRVDGAALDVTAVHERLAELERLGRLHVTPERIRWSPRGAAGWKAPRLVAALEHLAAAVELVA